MPEDSTAGSSVGGGNSGSGAAAGMAGSSTGLRDWFFRRGSFLRFNRRIRLFNSCLHLDWRRAFPSHQCVNLFNDGNQFPHRLPGGGFKIVDHLAKSVCGRQYDVHNLACNLHGAFAQFVKNIFPIYGPGVFYAIEPQKTGKHP